MNYLNEDPGLLAFKATAVLLGISLLVQTVEFLRLRASMTKTGVWAFDIQRDDFLPAPAFLLTLIGFLSRDGVYTTHLFFRLLGAVLLIGGFAPWPLILFLLMGTLLFLVRWRGAFNGGSDFMTLVVLTGLLIASVSPEAGLIYIALHASASYLLSGGVKLLNHDWRSGRALILFLDDSIMGPLADQSKFRKPLVATVISYAFILWEIAIPFAFLLPIIMLFYCTSGLAFHFLVFRYFGLNRFFFAWFATYPALLYAAVMLAN